MTAGPIGPAESSSMSRQREFDETEVLGRAVACFWQAGYRATSMRDLAARMAITGTSLYNAFDDKRSLFRRALEHYLAESRQRRDALEATLPPKEAIRQFLLGAVERSLEDGQRRGCFLINSALEIAPHDGELGAFIADRLSELQSFFARLLRRAQADGSLPARCDPDDIARLLLAVMIGVRVLARARPERALLEGLLRPALALLDDDHPVQPPLTQGEAT
jgi:TetR/AcrR family transcriptional regulator, transcriptional repressor for nem operon